MKTLLRIVVFIVSFCLLVIPSSRVAERLMTRDLSAEPISDLFLPVLVQSSDGKNKFSIDFHPGLIPQSKLVTEIKDRDLDKINRDLGSRIGAENSHYAYFKIIERGNGYTDVSLEVPTTGDFWPKSWYRIQDGSVHPQRRLFYGPGLAMIAAYLSALGGTIALLCCNRVLRYRADRAKVKDV
jgi:hypothetical protein